MPDLLTILICAMVATACAVAFFAGRSAQLDNEHEADDIMHVNLGVADRLDLMDPMIVTPDGREELSSDYAARLSSSLALLIMVAKQARKCPRCASLCVDHQSVSYGLDAAGDHRIEIMFECRNCSHRHADMLDRITGICLEATDSWERAVTAGEALQAQSDLGAFE